MIIYNKTWLNNLLVRNQVEKEYRSGILNGDELKHIQTQYPVGFYSPNLFIRIGLFLLTVIIGLFAGGLLSLILMDSHIVETPGYILFLGIVIYIVLELVIKKISHFKSGVDDALIWASSGLFCTAFFWFTERNSATAEEIIITAFLFVVAAYYTIRFSNVLMAAAGFASFAAFIFFLWNNLSDWGMTTMPFLMILVGILVYILCKRIREKPQYIHYNECIMALQVLSLLLLYLAGNYFVVETLGGYADVLDGKKAKVPFGLFFWVWTIVIPFVYIGTGIKKKDVLLLRTGLLLIAAAAFTFRNYYHVMPIEGTLTIIGASLLLIAYALMKYLKTPRNGFTLELLEEENIMDKLKLESLIVSETFSGTATVPGEQPRFGGGDFGGGGAGSNY